MRLLLRANAHRPVWDGESRSGVEVAASPDTPSRPERWAWHIRLFDNKPQLNAIPRHQSSGLRGATTLQIGIERTLVELSAGGLGTIEIDVDPEIVRALTEVLDTGDLVLERAEEDLLAVVASSGEVVLEDRYRLRTGDAIVLTGDDPLTVSVRITQGSAVVIRLQTPHGGPVGWVP